eukprot:211716_1
MTTCNDKELLIYGFIHTIEASLDNNQIIPIGIIQICITLYPKYTVNDENMKDKPNIKRILVALARGALADKYTFDGCGIDLFNAFYEFIIEEEFEDEQIPEEFADDAAEESFFIDWLIETKEMNESTAIDIWKDLNSAHKGLYDPISETEPVPVYNIEIKDTDLRYIEQQLKIQCGNGWRQRHTSIYAIIQIGKQNRNQPLLMYLVDAYNRYRIQKRKKVMLKLQKEGYNSKEVLTLFNQKFRDIQPNKFIQQKCKGIEKWLTNHTVNQKTKFLEMCAGAICVFKRNLLYAPPMFCRIAFINDDIITISEYIFQSYFFIEQFIQQNNSQLPTQIDLIIIPKNYELKVWEDSDEESDDSECKVSEYIISIGNINERLRDTHNKCGPFDIVPATANSILLQSINTICRRHRRCQRSIFIIDRRENNDNTDKCYGFQPNVLYTNPCHDFERNESKLLDESLIDNLRTLILPKGNDKYDINVNIHKSFGLTFSFHCFSSNEIRVYLFNNGWGTRFFIQDIKYFLPYFFVNGQHEKLKNVFARVENKEFADKYAQCKKKCLDKKFEAFCKSLFDKEEYKCY